MKASKKIKQKINPNKALVSGLNPWDKAIADAEISLAQVEKRAIELRRAIAAFVDLRDSGEPWPGTGESEQRQIVVNDTVKQDSRKLSVAEQQ